MKDNTKKGEPITASEAVSEAKDIAFRNAHLAAIEYGKALGMSMLAECAHPDNDRNTVAIRPLQGSGAWELSRTHSVHHGVISEAAKDTYRSGVADAIKRWGGDEGETPHNFPIVN